MDKIKALILLGQLGRIWAKYRVEKQVFQSLTAVAFFALYFDQKRKDKLREQEEIRDFNNQL